jgi:hypothetical protein
MPNSSGEKVNGGGDGGTTVTATESDSPPIVAETFEVPSARAETNPIAETLATEGLLEDQTMVWPVSAWPAWSFGCAKSSTVRPTDKVNVSGVTLTLETEAGLPPAPVGPGELWQHAIAARRMTLAVARRMNEPDREAVISMSTRSP